MQQADFEKAIACFQAVPRLHYGHYPTPLEEMPRLRQALGATAPRIFIKHDDYTGPGFGGNKVRKLEYVLARAKADGAEVAITCGSVKSNHARVTAALCARIGLRCVLVLNPSAVTVAGMTPASLDLDAQFGAEVIRAADRDARNATVEAEAERLRGQGKHVALIPLGASEPLGALGFVRGVEEAKSQAEAMGVRMDFLFHATSSGGTQAGIRAGCQLFDWAVEDIGVSSDDSSDAIAGEVGRIIRGVGAMLGAELDASATVLDAYAGAGYGVVLDPVYTAKAMAALLDWIRTGRLTADHNVLFWHTGGQLARFYVPES
jgi:L-cysteate sulfo-lyase